jgi:hypothetical protein
MCCMDIGHSRKAYRIGRGDLLCGGGTELEDGEDREGQHTGALGGALLPQRVDRLEGEEKKESGGVYAHGWISLPAPSLSITPSNQSDLSRLRSQSNSTSLPSWYVPRCAAPPRARWP